MDKYLLCIDDGGTFIKAALVDTQGRQIAIEKRYNQVISDSEGQREYNLDQLWETNCICMRKVIEKSGIQPEQIACIGFSGQGKGLYPVDAQGQPIRNAISSSDLRSKPICEQWEAEGLSAKLFPRIGQMPGFYHPVSILAWLKKQEPESYARVRWIFSMKDYLNFRLTGKATAGKGTQSGSCIVDLHTQEYAPELLDEFGLPEMKNCLPPMIWDTEICGTVTPEAALQCGCLPGTPVAAGMFDVDASAIAMGVIDEEPIFIITGTCAEAGYITSHPITDGSILQNTLYSLPGTYLIEEGFPASSGILEWVIRILWEEESRKDSAALYDTINTSVASVPAADSNLIFLPYLYGWRDALNAKGSWVGFRPEHTRAHLLRAVYEGIAFTHMLQLEHLLVNRERPSEILMAGGATNSDVWVQMFADIFQIPIRVVENEEMGVKGVAITSAVAVGLYPDITAAVHAMSKTGQLVQPNPALASVYAEKLERFKEALSISDRLWKLFL